MADMTAGVRCSPVVSEEVLSCDAACDGTRVEEDEELVLVELTVEEGDQLQELAEEMEKMLDLTNTLGSPSPSIELSPMECIAMQQEELEALRAIYEEDMTVLNDTGTCFCIRMKYLSDEMKDEDVIRVWFSLPPNYPCVPPVIEIETNTSGTFTYSDADYLYEQLMQGASQKIGSTMVFDLVGSALDLLPSIFQRRQERADKQVMADSERKRQIELVDALKDGSKGFIPSNLWSELVSHSDFNSSDQSTKKEHKEVEEDDDEFLFSHMYRPQQFVGPITTLLKLIPDTLQITRMENILRQDLAHRFCKCMQHMNIALSEKERQNPMKYSLKPRTLFHGTLTKSLPSIVQHGLVIPGAYNKVQVRCGSTYGKGIYLSPNADFSLGYTDSSRLIVCAAIPGLMCKENHSNLKDSRSPFHVFISSCGNEWVFFNAAQVLPCYVIQVSASRYVRSHRNPPPLAGLPTKEDDNSDIAATVALKEKREKLLARARKFLPYGFGPGSKTVIEDAADIDDDEEDYGDYQMLRYAQDNPEVLVMHNSGVSEEHSELQHYRHVETGGEIPTS